LIGKLTTISGTVTRSTEVRPELYEGTFICSACNTKNKKIRQCYKYTKPKVCKNPHCLEKNAFELEERDSLFCDW
jgi:DNA replication licensing factor MCM6